VIRYASLGSSVLLLHNQLFPDVQVRVCKIIFPVTAWEVVIQLFLTDVVIAIRTWAVWNRNRMVGITLGGLSVGFLGFSGIMTSRFLATIEYAPPPFPGYGGCFIIKADTEGLWPIYVFMTVSSATVLALMGLSAFVSPHLGNSNQLAHVVHRDGILFYFYLLVLIASAMSVKIAAPDDMKFLMDPLVNSLYPIFIVRIVLNIRQTANRGLQTEIHTGYHESSISFAVPLHAVTFASDAEHT